MDTSTEPRSDRRILAAAGFLFLVSGAAGLVYEVLWSRQLARVLGGSYPAVVAVVTAFLGGLALGAFLGGRAAATLRRPLRAYALLEGGVALYCAAFPLVLAALHPAFGWCYRNLSETPGACTAARFLLAGIAILPPTIAMGATLPILVRAVVGDGRATLLGGAGVLYGLNTVGAAGGAMLTGFVLLPGLGFSGTLLVGVGANLAVAAVALVLDRFAPAPPEGDEAAERPPAEGARAPAPDSIAARRVLLLLAFGGGFASMLYQLGWTRCLILCFGSSVHAFTLIVSTFVLGLGAGGLLAPLLRRRDGRLVGTLVLLEAAVGVAGWNGTVLLANLPLAVVEFHGAGAPTWGELLRWETAQTMSIALLPTLAMGALFPVLMVAVAAGGGGASRSVGRVYAVNTAGVLLGSLGGGMLLIPALGTGTLLLVAASLNLLLAAATALAALPRRHGVPAAAALAAAAAAVPFVTPPLLPYHFHSGPYMYARTYLSDSSARGVTLARSMRDGGWDMPYVREGRSAAVAVIRHPDGSVFLRVNGKTDASSVGDMSTQLLLGHLPHLARPGISKVLVVGLASGVSAGASASHGTGAVDVCEIAPEVAGAERFFRHINGDVTSRPGVRVILDDGRTHLEHAGEVYDAIVSEPSNPWIAGISDLFTEEYFRACRARLAPGGVLCVWLQAYGLGIEDFRLVVRTVRSVFPNAVVWESIPWQDYLLLAVNDDAADPVAAVASGPWPTGEAAASLATAGVRSREEVLASLFLDREGTAAFAAGGRSVEIHTDDRLQLEYRVPRSTLVGRGGEALAPVDLEAVRSPGDPARFGVEAGARIAALRAARRHGIRGMAAVDGFADPLDGGSVVAPYVAAPPLLEALLPGIPPALRGPVREKVASGRPVFTLAEAEAMRQAIGATRLEEAMARGCGEAWARSALARCLLARGDSFLDEGAFDEAERDYRRLREIQPENAMAPYSLSLVTLLRARDAPDAAAFTEALRLVDEAIAMQPRSLPALTQRGTVLHVLGRTNEAGAAFEHTLAVRPDFIRALAGLALLRHQQGRREEALILARAGILLQPRNPAFQTVLRELGEER